MCQSVWRWKWFFWQSSYMLQRFRLCRTSDTVFQCEIHSWRQWGCGTCHGDSLTSCCIGVHKTSRGLSKNIQCHKQHLTLLTTCRSPNETQDSKAIILVIANDHFDLPTGVCAGTCGQTCTLTIPIALWTLLPCLSNKWSTEIGFTVQNEMEIIMIQQMFAFSNMTDNLDRELTSAIFPLYLQDDIHKYTHQFFLWNI